jgi:SPP1 gp7 family putative phage head morphogenesis protein
LIVVQRTADLKPRGNARREETFRRAQAAETTYARQLRKIARHVGEIIRAVTDFSPSSLEQLDRALKQYAQAITPWARATANLMLAEVARRDAAAWRRYTEEMSVELRREIMNAPTGEITRALLAEQTALITSLPIEAAQRVQGLAMEAMIGGKRSSVVAEQIFTSTGVTISRANTIARTEVSKAKSALTEARATHIGSEGYIWRTAEDADVRPSHRAMDGKFVRWSDAPTLDGMKGHAGCFPNCRCIPLPVLPDRWKN